MKFVDLFAGAGGLTLGLSAAGLEPVYAVEFDKAAAATYEANFGPHIHKGPIQELKAFPTAEVVVGGPPCQGFSLLGAREDGDERNDLWRQLWRTVRSVEPEIFVVENVPGFLKSGQWASLRRSAARSGYSIEGRVLNAADFGAPQVRKRAIVIGRRGRPPIFPEPTHAQVKRVGLLPWVTVRDAFKGIRPNPDREFEGRANGVTTRALHFGRTCHPTSLLRYSLIPPGGNRFDLQRARPDITPPCWLNRDSHGSTDVFGRLWWTRPSVTIRTEFYKPEKGRYLHPEADRPITHYEAARLQGFPDDFLWHGSRTEVARQIGNAVPIALAAAVGRAVVRMLQGDVSTTANLFSDLDLEGSPARASDRRTLVHA